MASITKDPTRPIIEDFAAEIKRAKTTGPKPETWIIDFRNEKKDRKERPIYSVPTKLLRYRKDNGRIASDVYSYEKSVKPLDENNSEDQKILEDFLREKDEDQTNNLKNSILHQGQDEPAIITSDGFLINGNRRKMVFQLLREETHDPKFERMNVVILPGEDESDSGGPPTIKEIEQIENRYQLQNDGKSEYSSFDRALSIRRKIDAGMSLEDQLRDDPNFVSLGKREFDKKVREYKEKYLEPLKCIDRYLEYLGRQGYYRSISAGIGDREGRWQAFLDYYNFVYKKTENEKDRIKLGIQEDEVGAVEDIAFKLIRYREFPGRKVHGLMRELPKNLKNEFAKEELFSLQKITDLDPEEMIDSEGKEHDYETIDQKWRKKNATEIINRIEKASKYTSRVEEMETPISLLEQAYKKLDHDKMEPASIGIGDLKKAMHLAESVEQKAKELKNTFYQYQKNKDDFVNKHKRR